MTDLYRRELLRKAFLSAVACVSAPPLWASSARNCHLISGHQELALPAGPLSAISELGRPDKLGIALPDGFSCRLVAKAGHHVKTPGGQSATSDYRWHSYPDGGAVFARPDGGWVYTSNSEIPVIPVGGCGALGFNARGEVDSAYSILQKTTQNCAGGATPWNTWISCEETSDGLSYECDPFRPGQGVAKPSLGRFAHEAVAVDVKRRALYLTEDNWDGRFYRWTAHPDDVRADGSLALEKGVLEVMNIAGYGNDCYPEGDVLVRGRLPVEWVVVERPDEPQEDVRKKLRKSGTTVSGTCFRGGEGLWSYVLPDEVSRSIQLGEQRPDTLVFWTTKHDNRVWALDVASQQVELIFDNAVMDTPFNDVDNLTVSPFGDVIVAEDPPKRNSSRLMVVLPNKGARILAEVFHPGSEICGPAFTPDGSRLYFSSQRYEKAGATFEISIPEAFRRPLVP